MQPERMEEAADQGPISGEGVVPGTEPVTTEPEPTADEELREQAIKDAKALLEGSIRSFETFKRGLGNQDKRLEDWLGPLRGSGMIPRAPTAQRMIDARITQEDLERYKSIFHLQDYSDLEEHLYLMLKAGKEANEVPSVRVVIADGSARFITTPEDEKWRDELFEYLEESRRTPAHPGAVGAEEEVVAEPSPEPTDEMKRAAEDLYRLIEDMLKFRATDNNRLENFMDKNQSFFRDYMDHTVEWYRPEAERQEEITRRVGAQLRETIPDILVKIGFGPNHLAMITQDLRFVFTPDECKTIVNGFFEKKGLDIKI